MDRVAFVAGLEAGELLLHQQLRAVIRVRSSLEASTYEPSPTYAERLSEANHLLARAHRLLRSLPGAE